MRDPPDRSLAPIALRRRLTTVPEWRHFREEERHKPSPCVTSHSHTVRSASVGERRAARNAGRSPATAPMMMAAPNPPTQARVGTTTDQCLVWA
jgi:hypothetical protein